MYYLPTFCALIGLKVQVRDVNKKYGCKLTIDNRFYLCLNINKMLLNPVKYFYNFIPFKLYFLLENLSTDINIY